MVDTNSAGADSQVLRSQRFQEVLPDGLPGLGAEAGDGPKVRDLDEMVRRLGEIPLMFEPGTDWHYSVSLEWDASTDNSGFLTYWIQASNGYRMSVPMSRTSATFTDGINAGVTYWFQMYAVDGSGNKSQLSNKVTISLPPDTTASPASWSRPMRRGSRWAGSSRSS